MRILFPILRFYPNQNAGPSLSTYWLVKTLKLTGVETTVVTTSADIHVPILTDCWLESECGRVVYHKDSSLLFPWKAIRTALGEVKRHDIVQLYYFYNSIDVIVGLYAILRGKPVVWSASGMLDKKAIRYKALKKKIYLFFFKSIFAKRVIFHSTSAHETKDITRQFGNKARIVEYPNYIASLPRPNLPIQKYFLFVGRMDPIKNIETIIEAVKQSAAIQNSQFLFYIAGDASNSYGQKLQKMVNSYGLSNKIRFLGQVEGDVKHQLFAAAYCLILPSHSENFGNVVIEALSQGTPVIASTGTPWQILNDEKSGFWVENDVATLAATIENAIELSPDAYNEYRQNAILTSSHYAIEYNIYKWHEVYNSLLKNDNPGQPPKQRRFALNRFKRAANKTQASKVELS